MNTIWSISGIFLGGGGGGALRFRGGSHPRYVFRGKGVFFKTSACQRFCKNRTLFCTQVQSMGGGGGGAGVKICSQYTKYTPSDSRSDWASKFAAATCCR